MNDNTPGKVVSAAPCRACEEVVRTLGFDWLLMFLEEHVHSSTVTAALWILVVLLSHNNILHRFKEGLCGGGWLDHTDSVLTNKIGSVLGECRRPRRKSGSAGSLEVAGSIPAPPSVERPVISFWVDPSSVM